MSNVIKASRYTTKLERIEISYHWDQPSLPNEAYSESAIDLEDIRKAIYDQATIEGEKLKIELLNEANKEIQQMKEAARQEIEQWKANELTYIEDLKTTTLSAAKETGYQEGYAAGVIDGKQSYQKKINKASELLREAEQEYKKRVREAEPFVVNLSIDIAEKIIGKEINRDDHIILDMVKRSLKLTNELQEISIYAHPEDLHILKEQVEELRAIHLNQASLVLLPDASISRGGSLIRTSFGSLDSRIETQLEEIRSALLSVVQGSGTDE